MTKQQIIDVINFAFEKYPFSKYKIPVNIEYEKGTISIKSINDIKFTDYAVIFDYYIDRGSKRYSDKFRTHYFGYVPYDRIVNIEMVDKVNSDDIETIYPQKI